MKYFGILLVLLWGLLLKASDLQAKLRIDEALQRHKDDIVLWVKDKTNISLRPTQIFHIQEIFSHSSIVDILPPRFGKTVEVELANLYESALNPWEDGRIWAPKEDQAKESLKIQVENIESSPILRQYISRKSGKRQLSTTGYQFLNGSNWKVFGIYANFEGENATIIRGEEFDDIDIDIWNTRVLPRGGAANRNGLPTRIRLTGTIQEGKGNLYQADNDSGYHTLTKWDVNVGLKLGFYDDATILKIRETLSEDEWKRIYLLEYTEAKNFIHEGWLRGCEKRAMAAGWEGHAFPDGGEYSGQGVVVAGLDMGSSGTGRASSHYSAQFLEVIGETVVYLGGKRWRPAENPDVVKRDFVRMWGFYGAKYGYGDALKADLVRDINRMLYSERLIRTNPDAFEQHSQADWKRYDFAPVWNTSEFKWQNGYALAKNIELGQFVVPMGSSIRSQLLNIREDRTVKGRYPRLIYIKPEIGDDDFDALVMAKACALARIQAPVKYEKLSTQGGRILSGERLALETDFKLERASW